MALRVHTLPTILNINNLNKSNKYLKKSGYNSDFLVILYYFNLPLVFTPPIPFVPE